MLYWPITCIPRCLQNYYFSLNFYFIPAISLCRCASELFCSSLSSTVFKVVWDAMLIDHRSWIVASRAKFSSKVATHIVQSQFNCVKTSPFILHLSLNKIAQSVVSYHSHVLFRWYVGDTTSIVVCVYKYMSLSNETKNVIDERSKIIVIERLMVIDTYYIYLLIFIYDNLYVLLLRMREWITNISPSYVCCAAYLN